MNKTNTAKGTSFVERVSKVKSNKALDALILQLQCGHFPARNPATARKRRRAISAKRAKLAASKKKK